MHSKQHENLLSKRIVDGVALKTQFFQNRLSRLRGYRKLIVKNIPFTKLSRISLGILLGLYFAGYQPTLALPPVKKALVHALEQEQKIESYQLSQPFQSPHPGFISSRFSSWHPGLDIATGLGMPLHPVAPGKVVEATLGFFGLGHYVVVEHEQGFKSTYGHIGRVFVKVGDIVSNSSLLGEVGMTGRTTGPHTHLEITKDSKYINPILVLPALSDWPASAGQAPKGEGSTQPIPTPTVIKTEPTKTPVKISLFSLEKLANPEATAANKLKRLNYLSF